MNADGSTVERRKGYRFPVVVPIEVSWRGVDGIAVKEDAVARQVNANGGFLKMANYPEVGNRVTLANFLSAQTAEARVLASPYAREGVANGIVVELIVPNEIFWGVDLQVKKTIVELQNLAQALQCDDMNLRLVKEYREAVDCIRTAALTLQQLRECQLRGLNDDGQLSALASGRIRRTINLCLEVIEDLDAGRLTDDSEGVEQLCRVIEHVHDRAKVGKARVTDRDPQHRLTGPITRNSR
jgi:hypothetical protein